MIRKAVIEPACRTIRQFYIGTVVSGTVALPKFRARLVRCPSLGHVALDTASSTNSASYSNCTRFPDEWEALLAIRNGRVLGHSRLVSVPSVKHFSEPMLSTENGFENQWGTCADLAGMLTNAETRQPLRWNGYAITVYRCWRSKDKNEKASLHGSICSEVS